MSKRLKEEYMHEMMNARKMNKNIVKISNNLNVIKVCSRETFF